jgi:O-methyltransferase involved in polyketide biosynthesis
MFIAQLISDGVECVINLAAGLDARPYRMNLPNQLRWVEVDLPGLIKYKESILANDSPNCLLERFPLDLSDVAARRQLFDRIGRAPHRGLVITEGLLIYLTRDEVGELAQDLSAVQSFRHWIIDLASPGLLRMLQKVIGSPLDKAGASLKFAPEEGPPFFESHGWKPIDVRSMLRTAATLKRVSLFMRLLSMLPQSNRRQGARPWSAVCLLEKT